MRKHRSIIEIIENIFEWMAGIILFAVALSIIIDVLGRKVGFQSAYLVYDLVEMGTGLCAYLGLTVVQREKTHIKLDLFTSKLSPRLFHMVELGTSFIALVLSLIIAWQTGIHGLKSLSQHETSAGLSRLPLAPVRLAIFGAFALICLRQILQVVDLIRGCPDKEVS